ncbi:AAA-like domain-containing protein [Kamptonema animale CS-326]|jgi:hypothetical protein|uniref:AAA-like domain-containing protein n=1 Tax=Kamptonema animale TaxID=92934 RepID=UPI00232D36ED|nr:AAA-like domain-containing protein [Kamptonema animale]MDB9509709.1 AAA-like domain-containing protein [Kamptonema animale CS-326]
MNSNLNLTWEETLEIANSAIFENTQRYLKTIEVDVLHGIWQGKTYQEIADELGYTEHYINQDVVNGENGLWKKLSKALGEKITRSNYQEALKRKRNKKNNGQLLYLDRPPIESNCYDKIRETGAVIRITAPQYTGKTWLLNRILEHARENGCQTVILDFKLANSAVVSEYSRFLKWLCSNVSRELNLDNKLADFWDDDLYEAHDNITIYFEKYLLSERTQPLVIALKNVDLVFEIDDFRTDFCGLLRYWSQLYTGGNEAAEIWRQFRLVIVHSTDIYGSSNSNIDFSPLEGVGLTVKLPDFTPAQVLKLAQHYQLTLQKPQIEQFMAMFGGHPYLVQKALIHLRNNQVSLEKLLEIAPTEDQNSPFKNHLREYLAALNKNPELAAAYHEVVINQQPVRVEKNYTFKLESMGLVQVQGNDCLPRCGLYRQYFSVWLKSNE